MPELPPSARLRETLQILRATRKGMLSFDYLDALEKQPDAVRTEAAMRMLAVNSALRKLENRRLADIRDALIEEEAALDAATKSLSKSLERLRKVQKILDAAADILDSIGRIIALAF